MTRRPAPPLAALLLTVCGAAVAACGGAAPNGAEAAAAASDGPSAPPSADSDTAPTPGVSARPQNPTCLAPGKGSDGKTAFAPLLSQTGCFEPGDIRRPRAGLIYYDVNSPLWADGATKRRWLALPDGTQLGRDARGEISLPPGAVLLKEFALGGRILETRLLVRRADGNWAAATYIWNDAQTDATVNTGEWQTRDVGATTWTFYGPSGCAYCHTAAGGNDLGLRAEQLDRAVTLPGTTTAVPQLARWQQLGILPSAPAGAPATVPLADPYGSAAVTDRARSYLSVNCGSCHRAGARFDMGFDFDHATPLTAMGLCNKAPSHGTLGVAGARLVVPGSPATSLVALRMHAVGAARMPRFGSNLVDQKAADLIDRWIRELPACATP